jgi:hypothetical protein
MTDAEWQAELDHDMRNAGGLVVYHLTDWDGGRPEPKPAPVSPACDDDEIQALITASLEACDKAREANEQRLRAAGLL